MLVDSHCHLDFDLFDDDRDAVLDRARQAGVGMFVTICTRLSQLDKTLAIAERYDDVVCAVGIHPHNVAEEGVPDIARLEEVAMHPKVVGIGETGLDYYYDRSPREQQQVSFRVHIEAAALTGLPFIVHTRDADDDTSSILVDVLGDHPCAGLLHCFSSGRQLAEKAVELGMSVSLSGIATFKNGVDLRDIVRDIVPLDRILVETDAPFLAPVPHRGRRNEPAYVVETARVIAQEKGVSESEFAEITTSNFYTLFGKARGAGGC